MINRYLESIIEGRMRQGKAIVATISAFYITNNASVRDNELYLKAL